jgi:hypothetical protein
MVVLTGFKSTTFEKAVDRFKVLGQYVSEENPWLRRPSISRRARRKVGVRNCSFKLDRSILVPGHDFFLGSFNNAKSIIIRWRRMEMHGDGGKLKVWKLSGKRESWAISYPTKSVAVISLIDWLTFHYK